LKDDSGVGSAGRFGGGRGLIAQAQNLALGSVDVGCSPAAIYLVGFPFTCGHRMAAASAFRGELAFMSCPQTGIADVCSRRLRCGHGVVVAQLEDHQANTATLWRQFSASAGCVQVYVPVFCADSTGALGCCGS